MLESFKEDLIFYGNWIAWTFGLILLIVFLWNITAYRDIEYLEKHAPEYIESKGFVITSYQGYQGGPIKGGAVWYEARDTSGYLYQMAIAEWRGKLMTFDLECLNAVTNK